MPRSLSVAICSSWPGDSIGPISANGRQQWEIRTEHLAGPLESRNYSFASLPIRVA